MKRNKNILLRRWELSRFGEKSARIFTLVLISLCFGGVPNSHAERIKDLASIEGVRPNQLIGYGLVVGLDGSGDQTTQTPFTIQSLASMLTQLGVNLPPGTSLQLKNVAAVMVTASLPAFSKPGQTVDVTVSSIGNAKSLRGGTLLLTPLKGVDAQVYAVAQGNVAVGGAGASAGGSQVQVNHLSAGRITDGATVERGVPTLLGQGDYINLELRATDFAMAEQVVLAINRKLGEGVASAVDGRLVQVRAPAPPGERVGFLARVQDINVDSVVGPAKIVVNARTGSVVMNQAVTIEACAVAHGNLTVTINSEPVISQPQPFSQGQTVTTERAKIQIKQDGGALQMMPTGAQLGDVVKALNGLGATPQDLIAILQAMKSAGALRAELEII